MDIRKIIREELEKVFEADYYDRFPDFMDPLYNPLTQKYPPTGMHKFGTMVKEDMAQIGDISKDLVLVTGKRDGSDTFMILYNYETQRIQGIIGFQDAGGDNHVSVVAAEKGYGPLMYELAMMYSSPKGLMPTRNGDVKDSAKNVWIKFFNRDDIEKRTIDLGSGGYGEPFSDFFYDEKGEFEVDKMKKIFNTKYYKSPTPEFHKLVRSSKGIMKEKNLNLEDIIERGMSYFGASYS